MLPLRFALGFAAMSQNDLELVNELTYVLEVSGALS